MFRFSKLSILINFGYIYFPIANIIVFFSVRYVCVWWAESGRPVIVFKNIILDCDWLLWCTKKEPKTNASTFVLFYLVFFSLSFISIQTVCPAKGIVGSDEWNAQCTYIWRPDTSLFIDCSAIIMEFPQLKIHEGMTTEIWSEKKRKHC